MTRTIELAELPDRPWFGVENPTGDIDSILADELAYEVPNADHIDSVKEGHWDGQRVLYRRGTHTAPIGHLDRVRTVLEERGRSVTVSRAEGKAGDSIDIGWNFEPELWTHQREAVDALHDQGGGVVSIPMGGGKTIIALRFIYEVGKRAIILVHRQELLHQTADNVREIYGIEPGVIGDGEWAEGPVTVAMVQTLASRGVEDLSDYGVLVADECHVTAGASEMYDVGTEIDARYRVGLSATPWRRVDGEQLKIEGVVGSEAYHAEAEDLIDAGVLARPVFLTADPSDYGEQEEAGPDEGHSEAYERCIVHCDARNAAVVDGTRALVDAGRAVFVSVRRIEHGEILTQRLRDRGVGAEFIQGSDSTERRQSVLESLEGGDIPAVVSTLLGEGVDIPAMGAVVLAGGGCSDVEKIQRAGRALRAGDGGDAAIMDVRDRGRFFGPHFAERQQAFSEFFGRYGPSFDDGTREGRVMAWLEDNGVPLSEVSVSELSTGEVRVEVSGWMDRDDFDDYRGLMRSEDGVRYERKEEANYCPPEWVDDLGEGTEKVKAGGRP